MTALVYFGNNVADQNAAGVIPLGSAAVASRATFLAQLASYKLETFEYQIAGQRPTTDLPLWLFGSTVTLTQLDASLGNVQADKTPGGVFKGRFNTTPDPVTGVVGNGVWWQTSGTFQLDFVAPVSAFGFYGTDFGDFGGTVSIDVYLSGALINSGVVVGPDPGGQNGSLLFFGYLGSTPADQFDRLVFNVSGGSPGALVGFDDMVYGTYISTLPYNGPGAFTNAPTQCIVACPPATASTAVINVPFGFTDRWSTWAAAAAGSGAAFQYATVTLYSGLNMTGTMLGSAILNLEGTPTGSLFMQTVIDFSGVVKSVVLSNNTPFNDQLFFDHMEFGIPPELPAAPILTFGWTPINSNILTSINGVSEGVKFGLDFEDVIPGANAAPGTYADVAVGSFYNVLYPGTTFTNAMATRSQATGGNAQFSTRYLDSPAGAVLSLGNVAIKVATGQTRIVVNFPNSFSKSAFSMYYASAQPVVVGLFQARDAINSVGGGSPDYTQTVPATGTCSLPDVTDVYCAWSVCRLEFDGGYQSVTLTTSDPNALFDWVTCGYPVPSSGSIIAADNTPQTYYNNGVDSLGTAGPANGVPPPYPPIYGLTFSVGWNRVYLQVGPELAPDYYYLPGICPYVSNYGWTMLYNNSAANGYINVIGGFTETVSFFLRSGNLVAVCSDLNGTGAQVNLTTVTQRQLGGYYEYSFNGWARSIVFDQYAMVDGLRFGHRPATVNLLSYVPWTNLSSSDSGTSVSTSATSYRTTLRMSSAFTPDGQIWRDSTAFTTGADHWVRDVQTYDFGTSATPSAVVQFSFDGAVDGQTSFANAGTYGGVWSTEGSGVAAATGVSKFGTSSLHVTPSSTEPALELFWPLGFSLYNSNIWPSINAVSATTLGTLEAWVMPMYGTSSFGRTVVVYWGYVSHKRGAEWNIVDDNPDVTGHVGAYVYARAGAAGQIVLECFHSQLFVGSVTVAAAAWHHVALTISALSTVTFYVDGVRVATNSTAITSSQYPAEARVVLGQSDRYGTLHYYLSEARVTRGQLVYTGATYTMPSAPFAPQTPLAFPGQNYWLKLTLEQGSAGGAVDNTNPPHDYTGITLNQWYKMDVPLEISADVLHDISLEYKLQIATDSAGSNIVAISHPRGAKTLSIGQTAVAYTGNSSIYYTKELYPTTGSFEQAFTLNALGVSVPEGRNFVTNRLKNGWRVEPFEGFTLGATGPLTAYFPRPSGMITCTISGSFSIVNSSAAGQANTTFNGKQWLAATGAVTFSFDTPISVFGADITDAGDEAGTIMLVLTDTVGQVLNVPYPLASQASGSLSFVGFQCPGRRFVSVSIVNTTGAYGDGFGVDDVLVAVRDEILGPILAVRDLFPNVGTLADSVPTNGNYWTEAFSGASSLTNLLLSGLNSGVYVQTSAYGSTRYGAVLGNPSGRDVSLNAYFLLGTYTAGLELGIIARKVGNAYYHLTYCVYQAGTLTCPRAADYYQAMLVYQLTYYDDANPGGVVLLGPTEEVLGNTGIDPIYLRYDLIGNNHMIYVHTTVYQYEATEPLPSTNISTSLLASIYDNRILTGGQNGFSIKQVS